MSDVEQLQGRLEEIAIALKPQQLQFAINLVKQGMANVTQAYIDAGYAAKSAKQNAWRALQSPLIREYVDVSQLMAMQKAQVEVEYNEAEWLKDILEARDMALGRKDTPFLFFGEVKNEKVVNLTAFTRISDQLGRKLALFTEKVDLPHNSSLAQLMQSIQEEAQKRGPLSNS